jgi:hypothetical protein
MVVDFVSYFDGYRLCELFGWIDIDGKSGW